ncbi:MAG: hypothetical protein EAZ95_12400 [Bacteroidetes bacterium]|nr:MAG: hypothetical protein EAZ95_12400 [Bacteroidota bacterium]
MHSAVAILHHQIMLIKTKILSAVELAYFAFGAVCVGSNPASTPLLFSQLGLSGVMVAQRKQLPIRLLPQSFLKIQNSAVEKSYFVPVSGSKCKSCLPFGVRSLSSKI